MNAQPKIKTNSTDNWKHLLGKTVKEIIPHTGEPFASYNFHSEEVYLYDKSSISTIVLRNGVVIRCDELADNRRTIRVNPSEKIPVMIVEGKKIRGYLKDLSIAGAAFHHSYDSVFSVGSRIDISFALPIEGISRFFQISCRVHDNRNLAREKCTVVLFDLTDTPWKKRLLSRYVQLSSIHTELGLKDNLIQANPPYQISSS
ncbi:MAG: PilZ domain-containing protein [Geobacter sp.]|nr:MAG: PilZ domain-containing protein [Geobacter sp.]